jgi:uncharacterized protein (TIGR00304 family)
MNRYHIFSLIFLIGAIISFVIGFMEGDVEGGIFIIFPFVIGSGISSLIGIVLIFLSVLFYIFGLTRFDFQEEEYSINKNEPIQKKTSVKGGGVVLIGPIPIVFGSSWKIALVMMVLALIIILITLLFFRSRLF